MKGRLLVLLIIITSISFSFSCSSGGSGSSFKVIPNSHKYGTVAVPSYEDFDYVIKNGGTDIITIQQFNFTGASPSDFFISANGSVPQNLYGKSEITITIRFRPISKGDKIAILEIVHNKPYTDPLRVKLSGKATTAPMIEVDPMSHDFGSLWSQGKAKKEFTIKSLGTEDLIITGTSIGGSNAAEFSIISAPTIPVTMPPNSSITMEVEWTAGTPASKTASLNLQHNAAGGSTSVALTATAIPYVGLQITTNSLSNGTVWTTYTDKLDYTGGNGNEEWSVLSGDFPAGLDINPTTGDITGKPAYPGTYNFTIQIDDQISQDDHQYHISVAKDGSWSDVTPNGFSVNPRSGVANHGFDLYYFGGVTGTNGVTAIKIFDTKKGTFSTANVSLQYARERAVAACIGKNIYIIGGRSNSTSSASTIGQVERYDTEKKTITSDSYMPSGGQYNTCCGVHNGKIYIIGGATPPGGNLVYEFTPGSGTAGGTWTTKANLTLSTAGMGFVSYNSKMYVVGGFAYGSLNEIYEYDPTLGQGTTPVGQTVQRTGRMQYGFITESLYMVDNGDNLQKFNFDAFTAHSSAYPNCPLTTMEMWSSQNVECMGRIYVTEGDSTTMLNQVYAYCP